MKAAKTPIPAIALEAGCDPIVGKRETAALMNFSVSTLDRQVKRGEFPPPVMQSERRRGWPLSVIKERAKSLPVRQVTSAE